MIRKLSITLFMVAFFVPAAGAQEISDWLKRTKFSVLAFGDAYWLPTNDNPALTAENGFWLRRTYLTMDHSINEELSFRIRFEANSPGDFTSSTKLEPFVKDLYLRWTEKDHQVYLGISGTPIWGVVEKVWGYRHVEKTPLDLQKMGSSRDFGVAAKGRLDSGGKLRYHVMVGNGSGTKGETNAGKKGALGLSLYPGSGFVIEAYGDYEGRPGDNDRTVVQLFAAWQSDEGRLGVQVARQHRNIEGASALNLDVASFFGSVKLSERAVFLARYDRMFEVNPDAAKIAYIPLNPTANSNLLLAGIDVTLADEFHLIPNVEAVFYHDAQGPKPDSEVMFRTTFFVTF